MEGFKHIMKKPNMINKARLNVACPKCQSLLVRNLTEWIVKIDEYGQVVLSFNCPYCSTTSYLVPKLARQLDPHGDLPGPDKINMPGQPSGVEYPATVTVCDLKPEDLPTGPTDKMFVTKPKKKKVKRHVKLPQDGTERTVTTIEK
jgi:hypothetical protein